MRPPAFAAAPADSGKRAAAPSSSCRHQGFDEFLRDFERDVAFQRSRVADPFEMQYVDAQAEPEPAVITTRMRRRNAVFPIYPSPDTQWHQGLVREVEERDAEAQVRLRIPDTDHQVRYRFARRPCWMLVGSSNDSL